VLYGLFNDLQHSRILKRLEHAPRWQIWGICCDWLNEATSNSFMFQIYPSVSR